MTGAQRQEQLRQQRRRLLEIRFQQATGQVANHRQLRAIRREIARLLTIEREIAMQDRGAGHD